MKTFQSLWKFVSPLPWTALISFLHPFIFLSFLVSHLLGGLVLTLVINSITSSHLTQSFSSYFFSFFFSLFLSFVYISNPTYLSFIRFEFERLYSVNVSSFNYGMYKAIFSDCKIYLVIKEVLRRIVYVKWNFRISFL